MLPWISVSKELPEIGERVIAWVPNFCDSGKVYDLIYGANGFNIGYPHQVTHWLRFKVPS
jgi:hypothetical protein